MRIEEMNQQELLAELAKQPAPGGSTTELIRVTLQARNAEASRRT